jgi:trans-2,3-dihydro-3-hydroxyanthranilate isomerase
VIALVATVDGAFAVDLEDGTVLRADAFDPAPEPVLNLPRLVSAASAGATVVAVVARTPPRLVSHDAGATWRASGRGLPPGRAIANAEDDPATGSAAGPLAIHLARHGRIRFGEQIEISQGAEINRPSTLYATAEGEGDRVDRVEVGGSAVVVARGELAF